MEHPQTDIELVNLYKVQPHDAGSLYFQHFATLDSQSEAR